MGVRPPDRPCLKPSFCRKERLLASCHLTAPSAHVNLSSIESHGNQELVVLNDCATIQLSQGLNTLIDDCDRAWLSLRKWSANTCGRNRYAFRFDSSRKRTTVLMHREIAGSPPGVQVDHKNRDKLDNRRENLRPATPRNNSANTGKAAIGATSKYKGVSWSSRHGVWYASIVSGGRNIHLGTFDSETDAAYAYDRAAREFHGEFAFTNFATDDPDRGKRRPWRGSARAARSRDQDA